MKYCQHCGAEIEDDAVICVHCGCATNDGKEKSANKSNLGKIALIFMILGCVGTPLSVLSQVLDLLSSNTVIAIIGIVCGLLPLAWCIPMTIIYSRKLKNNESVGTGFKICTLLFVNIIAGILMLCMPSDNK